MRSMLPAGLAASVLVLSGCQPTCVPCDPCEQVVQQSFIHKYGVEVAADDWAGRGSSGQVISTQKNGVMITYNYVDGILNGETTYTYPHSKQIEKVEVYENGELVSYYTKYQTGNVKEEVELDRYTPGNRNVTTRYETGGIRSKEIYQGDLLVEGDYYTPQNRVESSVNGGNGTRSNRNDYGVLVAQDEVVNGDVQTTTYFYLTGGPKEIVPYKNRLIEGVRKFYYSDGEPSRYEEWQQGLQTGVTTLFENGEKVAEVPYVRGYKNGTEKRYRDETYVVEEISWLDDQRHGPYTSYVGGTQSSVYYYKGKTIPKSQFERLTTPITR